MKKRILVVEDEKHQRTLLEQELTRAGYEVTCVSGGRGAVERVATEAPDLVVLDIGMPDMDGLQAMERILDRDRKLPVVIYTAYPSFKDDFLSWAADAYVVKSGDMTELLAEVSKALQRSETGGAEEAEGIAGTDIPTRP